MNMGLGDDVEAPDPLIAALADGQWQTGPRLAAGLGISRSAVSARVARLRENGIDVFTLPGKGYRLVGPVELLSAPAIRAELSPMASDRLDQLILYQRVDSTNTLLAGFDDGATRACLAEAQTAGRGRAGRPWVSPFATNLYLSVAHDLCSPRAPLATLSLAVGVALAERLESLGIADIGLKWPNDLWLGTAKVGGILTEARSEVGGAARVIVGLGLNIAMTNQEGVAINQPWARLVDQLPHPISRSALAGRCLDAIVVAMSRFESDGFAPFGSRWLRYDRLVGEPVTVCEGGACQTGIARGIGADGSLAVDINGQRRAVHSGEVRIRLVESGTAATG